MRLNKHGTDWAEQSDTCSVSVRFAAERDGSPQTHLLPFVGFKQLRTWFTEVHSGNCQTNEETDRCIIIHTNLFENVLCNYTHEPVWKCPLYYYTHEPVWKCPLYYYTHESVWKWPLYYYTHEPVWMSFIFRTFTISGRALYKGLTEERSPGPAAEDDVSLSGLD